MGAYQYLLTLAEKWDWPVLKMEIKRCRRGDKGMYFAPLIAAILAAVAVITYAFGVVTSDPILNLLMRLTPIALGLLRFVFAFGTAPSFGARCIVAEREAARFDALAMTPLSSTEIIKQKAFIPALFALIITVLCLPIDIITSGFSFGFEPWIIIWPPILFILESYANLSIGILCSTRCASFRAASSLTSGVVFLLHICLLVLAGPLLFELLGLSPLVCLAFVSVVAAFVIYCIFQASATRLEALRRGTV